MSSAREAELKSRFLSAVESRRDSLQKLSVHIGVSASATKTKNPLPAQGLRRALLENRELLKSVDSKTFRSEYAVKEGSFFWESSKDSDAVMALNPEYAFRIDKSKDSSVYSLNLLEQLHRMDPEAQMVVDHSVRSLNGVLGAAWCVYGIPLTDLVESESFRLRAIEEFERERKTLVRVKFDCLKGQERSSESLSDGVMIFDPSLDWVLTEYAANRHDNDGEPYARHYVYHELGDGVNGVPMVNRIHASKAFLNLDRVDHILTEVEVLSMEVEEDRFFLSEYGLPEPYFETQWAGAWLVYGLAGCLCFGLAYFMRRREAVA